MPHESPWPIVLALCLSRDVRRARGRAVRRGGRVRRARRRWRSSRGTCTSRDDGATPPSRGARRVGWWGMGMFVASGGGALRDARRHLLLSPLQEPALAAAGYPRAEAPRAARAARRAARCDRRRCRSPIAPRGRAGSGAPGCSSSARSSCRPATSPWRSPLPRRPARFVPQAHALRVDLLRPARGRARARRDRAPARAAGCWQARARAHPLPAERACRRSRSTGMPSPCSRSSPPSPFSRLRYDDPAPRAPPVVRLPRRRRDLVHAQFIVGVGASEAVCNPASCRWGSLTTRCSSPCSQSRRRSSARRSGRAARFPRDARRCRAGAAPAGRMRFFAIGAMAGNLVFLLIICSTGIATHHPTGSATRS